MWDLSMYSPRECVRCVLYTIHSINQNFTGFTICAHIPKLHITGQFICQGYRASCRIAIAPFIFLGFCNTGRTPSHPNHPPPHRLKICLTSRATGIQTWGQRTELSFKIHYSSFIYNLPPPPLMHSVNNYNKGRFGVREGGL